MKTTYDVRVDAAAIFNEGRVKSARTVSVTDDINLDYDSNDELVCIEVLNASRYFPPKLLAALRATG
jgi:uncharacterized protein YuzE